MMQGIGGFGAPDASQIRNMFSRIDTDGDGKVTRDEFVAGAPDGDDDKAGQLFDALDSQGSGSLSESDMLSAFQQLASQMQAVLIQQQQGHQGPPDPSSFFDNLDTDGDGSVSKEEFVAGRPDGVSEEDATSFFDELDSEGTGSLTKDQFVEAMQDAAPPPPPNMAGGQPPGGGMDSNALFDELDTNQDGTISMAEWLAGRPEDMSEEDATALFNEMDSEGTGSITKEQLAENMEAHAPGQPADTAAATEDQTDQSSRQLIAMLLDAIKSYEKSSLSGYASTATTTSVAA